MINDIALPKDLLARARREADRNHQGDLTALVASALGHHLALRDQFTALSEAFPEGEPEETRLARAFAAGGIPVDGVAAMSDALARVASAIPGYQNPGTPEDHLRPFLDWAAADPLSNHIGCVVVTAQAAAGPSFGIVGYCRGFLRGEKGTLAGRLQAYFSDRTSGPSAAPFSPDAVDDLGVTIAVDSLSGLVTVGLTAHSWGGARQTLSGPRVEDGVLLCTGDPVGHQAPRALYAIALSMVTAPS